MGHIVAVGHRGMRNGLYPENTIQAHEEAYRNHALGIEFDIRCSASGEFFLFHDASLSYKTNGSGFFSRKSSDEIIGLKLKHKKVQTDFSIPTLKEALENVRGRFMVDIDFKDGPLDSEGILRKILEDAGFARDGAPLVSIFCRDKHAFDKVKGLNDLYSVRPLYGGSPLNRLDPFFKKRRHAQKMRNFGINVMGLREYQFEVHRAEFLRELPVYIFANTMKTSAKVAFFNDRRDKRDSPRRHKHPKTTKQQREDIRWKAVGLGPIFMQTDYLDELVPFLKENGLYQHQVLGRDFQPINSPSV